MLWSNWRLTEKIDSRSQCYSRSVLYFVKLLNSRTFPSYQSMCSNSLAQYNAPAHWSIWPSYQTWSDRTHFTGSSYSKLYPWYPVADLCAHDQEWSSYHGLTIDSSLVEFSLPGCDDTLLCYKYWAKLPLLRVSSSNVPVASPYGNHKVKSFSSNLLHRASRLGTGIHLQTAVTKMV